MRGITSKSLVHSVDLEFFTIRPVPHLSEFTPEVESSCLLSIIVLLLIGVGGGRLKFVHAQFLFPSDPLHTEGIRYDLTLTLFLLKSSAAFGV